MYAPRNTSDQNNTDGGESSRDPSSSAEAQSPDGSSNFSRKKSEENKTIDIPVKKVCLDSRTSAEDVNDDDDMDESSSDVRIGMANGTVDNQEASDDASENIKDITSVEADTHREESRSSNQELLEYEDTVAREYLTYEGNEDEDLEWGETEEGEYHTFDETNNENEESYEEPFCEEEENESEGNYSDDEEGEERTMVIDEPSVQGSENDVVVLDDSEDDDTPPDIVRQHQNSRKRHLPYAKSVSLKRKRVAGMRRLPKPEDVMCISSDEEENNSETNPTEIDSEVESIEDHESDDELDSDRELYYDEENDREFDVRDNEGKGVYILSGRRRRSRREEELDNENFSEHSEEHLEDEEIIEDEENIEDEETLEDEENLSEQSEDNAQDDEDTSEPNEEKVAEDKYLSGEVAEGENIEENAAGEGIEHEPFSDNCIEIIDCKTAVEEENEIGLNESDKAGGSSEDLSEYKKDTDLEESGNQIGIQEVVSEEELMSSEDGEENILRNKKVKLENDQQRFQGRKEQTDDDEQANDDDDPYDGQIHSDERSMKEEDHVQAGKGNLKRNSKYKSNAEHKFLHSLRESMSSDSDEANDQALSVSSDENFDANNGDNSFNTDEENIQAEAYYQTHSNEEVDNSAHGLKESKEQGISNFKDTDKRMLVTNDENSMHKHSARKKVKMSREDILSSSDHSTDIDEDEEEDLMGLQSEYDSDNEEGMIDTEGETSDENDCFIIKRHRYSVKDSENGESVKNKMQVIKRNDILLSKTYSPIKKQEEKDMLIEVGNKDLPLRDVIFRCLDKRPVKEECLTDFNIASIPDFLTPTDSLPSDVVPFNEEEFLEPTGKRKDTQNGVFENIFNRLPSGKVILPDKEKLCRLCLESSQPMYPLFLKESPKENKEKLKYTTLSHVWSCIPIHIKEHDELPKKVCQRCYRTLLDYFKFSEKLFYINGVLESHFEYVSCDVDVPATAISMDNHSERSVVEVAPEMPFEESAQDVMNKEWQKDLKLRPYEEIDLFWKSLCNEPGEYLIVPGFKVTSSSEAEKEACEGNDAKREDNTLCEVLDSTSVEVTEVTKSVNDLSSDKQIIFGTESQETSEADSIQKTSDFETHVSYEKVATPTTVDMNVEIVDVKDTKDNNTSKESVEKEADDSADIKINDQLKNIDNISSLAENVQSVEQVVSNIFVMEVEEHDVEINVDQSVAKAEEHVATSASATEAEEETAKTEHDMIEGMIAKSMKVSEKIEASVSNEDSVIGKAVSHIAPHSPQSSITENTCKEAVTQEMSAMEIDEDDKNITVTYPTKPNVPSATCGSVSYNSASKKRKRTSIDSGRPTKTARADTDNLSFLNYMLDDENFIVMQYSTFEGLFQHQIETPPSTHKAKTVKNFLVDESTVSEKSVSNSASEVKNQTSECPSIEHFSLPSFKEVVHRSPEGSCDKVNDQVGNKNEETFNIPESCNRLVVVDSEIKTSGIFPSKVLSSEELVQADNKNELTFKSPDSIRETVKELEAVVSDLCPSETSSVEEVWAEDKNEENHSMEVDSSLTVKDIETSSDHCLLEGLSEQTLKISEDSMQAVEELQVVVSDLCPSETLSNKNQVQAENKNEENFSMPVDSNLTAESSETSGDCCPSEEMSGKELDQADKNNEQVCPSETLSIKDQVQAENKNEENCNMSVDCSLTAENSETSRDCCPSEELSDKELDQADKNNEQVCPSATLSVKDQVQAENKNEENCNMSVDCSLTTENSETSSDHCPPSEVSAVNKEGDNKCDYTSDIPISSNPSVEDSQVITASVVASETGDKNELSGSSIQSVEKSEVIISDSTLKTENSETGVEHCDERTSTCENTSEMKQSAEVVIDEVEHSVPCVAISTDSVTLCETEENKKDSSDPR